MKVITLDTDWAPDFMLEYVSDILTKRKIKATWFITNDSPFLEKLKQNPLFELGLHPNFDINSTQGKNIDDILKNLKNILPDAKSIRTHALLQSTRLFSKFYKYGIENDSSIFLSKTPNIIPHFSKYLNLNRFPYFWEDDFYMADNEPWSLKESFFQKPGLQIFDFHPFHIFLNSNTMQPYELVKNKIGFLNITQENIKQFINTNESGSGTLFNDLTSSLYNKDTYTIQDLKNIYDYKNNL